MAKDNPENNNEKKNNDSESLYKIRLITIQIISNNPNHKIFKLPKVNFSNSMYDRLGSFPPL